MQRNDCNARSLFKGLVLTFDDLELLAGATDKDASLEQLVHVLERATRRFGVQRPNEG